jgi:hypothetical protein
MTEPLNHWVPFWNLKIKQALGFLETKTDIHIN